MDGWMDGAESPNNLVKRGTVGRGRDGRRSVVSLGGGEFVRRTENNRQSAGRARQSGKMEDRSVGDRDRLHRSRGFSGRAGP